MSKTKSCKIESGVSFLRPSYEREVPLGAFVSVIFRGRKLSATRSGFYLHAVLTDICCILYLKFCISCLLLGSVVNPYIALIAVSKLFNTISINFFPDKCKMPLGLEDFRLDSGALTASSYVNYNHGPERARLNWPSGHSRAGGWVAKVRNSNQWLQVELDRPAKITGVATQGRYDAYQWVTTYTVSYSMDGKAFKLYLEYGRNKVTMKKKGNCLCRKICCGI